MRYIFLIAFIATIPAANWLIGNFGTECIPDGPCLVPVGFGLMAPSGVLLVGAGLVFRDAVQQFFGLRIAIAAILTGVVLSAILAPPSLVIASALAFGLAEGLDLAVYTPLRKRHLPLAVLASGAVGAVVDSAVFLFVAFGNFDYIGGQIAGKLWFALAAFGFLSVTRSMRVLEGKD